MRKKGLNVLWIIYSVILAGIIVISTQDCVKFVPENYEGMAVGATVVDEDADRAGYGQLLALPEPSYESIVKKTAIPCALCCLLFFFKNKVTCVFGCLSAFFLLVTVAFSGTVIDFISDRITSFYQIIGRVRGHHELTLFGIAAVVLCAVVFVFSIVLTVCYAKEKKKER